MNSVSEVFPIVVNNHLSVQAAANISGYSLQYLRRLLWNGKLEGFKIGQVWLIEIDSFTAYLGNVESIEDHRFGPRKN